MHVRAQDLEAALAANGLRLTAARRAICRVLARSHDQHLTATDLLRKVKRASPGVNLSTIYRTLEALEGAGLLHHVHLGHGPGIVHLSEATDHHHLYCERCGKTVDLPLPELGPSLRRLAARHGFRLGGVHFAIAGLCQACAAESDGPTKLGP